MDTSKQFIDMIKKKTKAELEVLKWLDSMEDIDNG